MGLVKVVDVLEELGGIEYWQRPTAARAAVSRSLSIFVLAVDRCYGVGRFRVGRRRFMGNGDFLVRRLGRSSAGQAGTANGQSTTLLGRLLRVVGGYRGARLRGGWSTQMGVLVACNGALER
jgi:hypothetical protein